MKPPSKKVKPNPANGGAKTINMSNGHPIADAAKFRRQFVGMSWKDFNVPPLFFAEKCLELHAYYVVPMEAELFGEFCKDLIDYQKWNTTPEEIWYFLPNSQRFPWQHLCQDLRAELCARHAIRPKPETQLTEDKDPSTSLDDTTASSSSEPRVSAAPIISESEQGALESADPIPELLVTHDSPDLLGYEDWNSTVDAEGSPDLSKPVPLCDDTA